MVAFIDAVPIQPADHLRPLDIQRDLLAIADLIELCFASTMDPDGEQYLHQMRQYARDAGFFRWASSTTEQLPKPFSGFIWEENGKLVGNLSLIPLTKQGKRVYFIANVAVHPDFRRKGIARALTEAAIHFIRDHHISNVWLQVREDNFNAHQLYLTEGFIERARRISWQIDPGKREDSLQKLDGVSITYRNSTDWDLQKTWLSHNYPPEVAWNLPFNVNSLKPAFLADIVRFLDGNSLRHYAARERGQLIGTLTFEPTTAYADNLWLAVPSNVEEHAIINLIPYVLLRLPAYRPLLLNYPAKQAEGALSKVGFKKHQTLIWMEAILN